MNEHKLNKIFEKEPMTKPKSRAKEVKARLIYLIERPEIWPNGTNKPVLYGCYKNRKTARIVAKYDHIENLKHPPMTIKYGKLRVIKFREVKQ